MWPPLGAVARTALPDMCLHLFQHEWLHAGTSICSFGAPVPNEAAAVKLFLLVHGSVVVGVPRLPEGEGRDVAAAPAAGSTLSSGATGGTSSAQGLVVLHTISAKRKDMGLLLGIEAIGASVYPATIVCKCARHCCACQGQVGAVQHDRLPRFLVRAAVTGRSRCREAATVYSISLEDFHKLPDSVQRAAVAFVTKRLAGQTWKTNGSKEQNARLAAQIEVHPPAVGGCSRWIGTQPESPDDLPTSVSV